MKPSMIVTALNSNNVDSILQGESGRDWLGNELPEYWFKKHNPLLWEDIDKCGRMKDIDTIRVLNMRGPCLKTIRKKQDNVYKYIVDIINHIDQHWLGLEKSEVV